MLVLAALAAALGVQAVVVEVPAHYDSAALLRLAEEAEAPEAAAAVLEEALARDRLCKDCYDRLSSAYAAAGNTTAAAEVYARAVALAPQSPELRMTYVQALQSAKDDAEAYRHSRLAAAMPVCADLFARRPFAFPEFRAKAACPNALARSVHFAQTMVDLDYYERWLSLLLEVAAFMADHYLEDERQPLIHPHFAIRLPLSPADQLRYVRLYAHKASKDVGFRQLPPAPVARPPPGSKIRVGYVAPDFDADAVVTFLLSDVFGGHDPARFEVYCYAINRKADKPLAALRDMSDVHKYVDLSDAETEEIAQQIRSDGIHVAVDLQGHIRGGNIKVFALRPAPIQISYLGFIGTSGADYFDYLVTDPIASLPETEAVGYAEKLIYMPDSFFVGSHWRFDSAPGDPKARNAHLRAEIGLPAGKFVFGSFNNAYKVTSTVMDWWADILHRAPNSVMWFLRKPPESEIYITAQMETRGIGTHRLFFTDTTSIAEYLQRASQVDVMLDTITYSAGGTAIDFLFAGVPIITIGADTMVSRMSRSMLTALGVPELIANSRQEYVDLAVALATDPLRYGDLRARLVHNRDTAPLYSPQKWVCYLEQALERVWDATGSIWVEREDRCEQRGASRI